MALPLLIGGVCIITSIIGTYMVRLGAKGVDHGRALQGLLDRDPARAFRRIYGAAWYALGGDLGADRSTVADGRPSFTGWNLVWASFVGLAVTALIVWITEYYTGTNYRPVQSIAKAPARPATAPTSSRAWRSASNRPRCRRS